MSLLERAGEINQDIIAGTMIIVGLFVTFFGARFFKHIVFFIGFILGAFIAYFTVPLIFEWFEEDIQDDTLLYMSLSIGALCGVLLVVVYKAAVFSCGAIGGAILSQMSWIFVVSNVDVPDKDWMIGVQIGVLFAFALIGGWLAFKFVEQILKAVTAFIGGFMFASGFAFCLSRLVDSGSLNLIDWVVFFGKYQNYMNLEAVCDVWCIVCVLLWLVFFALGCFIQYKCHRRHHRKDNDDEYESDSEMTEYDYSPEKVPTKSKKQAQRRHDSEDAVELGMASQYGGYAGSLRAANHYPLGSQSSQPDGSYLGSVPRPNAPSSVAMSEYGASYHGQGHQALANSAMDHHSQFANYGQRSNVHYV